MKLIRYQYPRTSESNPLNHLFDFTSPVYGRVSTLFDEFFGAEDGVKEHGSRSARADFYENASSYLLRVELSGASKESISVEASDGSLEVRAQSRSTDENVSESSVARVVTIPDEVDVSAITAAYENGLLSVTLPKQAKKAPLSIEIK